MGTRTKKQVVFFCRVSQQQAFLAAKATDFDQGDGADIVALFEKAFQVGQLLVLAAAACLLGHINVRNRGGFAATNKLGKKKRANGERRWVG